MSHRVSLVWGWFVWTLTYFVPDFPLSMRFRGWLYSFGMPKCGSNFQVASTCRILGLDTLYVGNDVYFASNVFINGGGAITLEDQVMIGIGSVVVSGNHSLIDGSYRWGDRDVKPIEIGFGSWVGANCTVLAGAKIPCSTVIAANSAVKGVLMYSGIYAGLPAKRVR